ncbi:MAG: WXG100 family type VII secretion target [Sciscionella sp.]|nr:WXG100 family type VII secretion target [Sciscionella sp.]
MGDIGSVKVTFGEVHAASGQITSLSNAVEQELDELQRQIQVLETSWTGASGSGFEQVKNQWISSAQDMKAVLAKIGTAVGSAAANYEQTEANQAKRWQ